MAAVIEALTRCLAGEEAPAETSRFTRCRLAFAPYPLAAAAANKPRLAPRLNGSTCHRRRVYILAPGSGDAIKSLRDQAERYVAFGPAYDVHGSRYPPGWASMFDVVLDETTAMDRGIEVSHIGRSRASARNLATWSSTLYSPATLDDVSGAAIPPMLRCVDLSRLPIEPARDGDAHHSGAAVGPMPGAMPGVAERVAPCAPIATVELPTGAPTGAPAGSARRRVSRLLRLPGISSSRQRSSSETLSDRAAPEQPVAARVETDTRGDEAAPRRLSNGDEPFAPPDLTPRAGLADVEMSDLAVSSLDCLVCGSRGGQVTLPALWLLGLRLPCVVINGGCARESVGWTWPAGVPVVLLSGGDDFFNESRGSWAVGEPDPHTDPLQYQDCLYLAELWAAVPPQSRPTTAILHLPGMGHRPDAELLASLLPALVEYASSRLSDTTKPTTDRLRGQPALLVTAGRPEGEWLVDGA